MNYDDLLQPTLIVAYSEDGHRSISVSWPDPVQRPRFVKLTPELLEEFVATFNQMGEAVCGSCNPR